MRKPKFEIFSGKDSKYYYCLKAANGEAIMKGRGYNSKPGIIHSIANVISEAGEETRFSRKTAANGQFFFQLRAKSGRIIGWSELYQTRQGRDKGIRAVQRAVQHGRIIDLG